jgi:hypothetical protein
MWVANVKCVLMSRRIPIRVAETPKEISTAERIATSLVDRWKKYAE